MVRRKRSKFKLYLLLAIGAFFLFNFSPALFWLLVVLMVTLGLLLVLASMGWWMIKSKLGAIWKLIKS